MPRQPDAGDVVVGAWWYDWIGTRVLDDGLDGGEVVWRVIVGFAAGCAEVEEEGLFEERRSGVVDPVRGIRFVESLIILQEQIMRKGTM
jgi:hypothetical protein